MDTAAVLVWIAIAASSIPLIVTVIRAQRDSKARGVAEEIRSVYEAAFLGGGPSRVVDTAVSAMHADGRLNIGGPGIVIVARKISRDPVERAVLAHLANSDDHRLNTLRYTVMRKPAVTDISSGLTDRGLLIPLRRLGSGPVVWGHGQAVLCWMGLTTATALTVVSHTHDWERPELPFVVLVLPALVWGIVTGHLMARRVSRRATTAGRRALRAYRRRSSASMAPGQHVAVSGASGAQNPVLRTLLAASIVVPVAIATTAGGDGGGGGGDGGGDGGSCGGCGGCGCG
ncbi:TIGR04222 domain-containing membrane protein [Streptomyces sp. NPDC005963]|uniref:TIGR04222 domain-containing membrane protein n=1 Tax=Streptomyces sp. NPDC005963 TaxID=3156721 RepID=UPI0033F56736